MDTPSSDSGSIRKLDLTEEPDPVTHALPEQLPIETEPYRPLTPNYDLARDREGTRSTLARGLLWLLTFTVGGVLIFIGLGQLTGEVLTQSVFPSLIALAGTALGFYFGSEGGSDTGSSNNQNRNG